MGSYLECIEEERRAIEEVMDYWCVVELQDWKRKGAEGQNFVGKDLGKRCLRCRYLSGHEDRDD